MKLFKKISYIALLLAATQVHAVADVKPLPTPAGVDTRLRIFALGKIEQTDAYAVARDNQRGEKQLVCHSDNVYIVAPAGSIAAVNVKKTLGLAVQKLSSLCEGKVYVARRSADNTEDRVRTAIRAEWLDVEEFKKLRADQSFDTLASEGLDFSGTNEKDIKPAVKSREQMQAFSAMLKTNLQNLKDLFKQHAITQWVSLSDLEKKPSAYTQGAVISSGKFVRKLSNNSVLITEIVPRSNTAVSIVLSELDASKWRDGSYVVVFQVGNSVVRDSSGFIVAKLVQMIACKEVSCDDVLSIPGPVEFPGHLGDRVLKTGEKLR